MAINEQIVTGRRYRRLIEDGDVNLWQRISFWTMASDVEFDDGETLEDKISNLEDQIATGDAEAEDVLEGKTFSASGSVGVTGTMTNNGSVSVTLEEGESYTIPEGYHDGTGTVTAEEVEAKPLRRKKLGTGSNGKYYANKIPNYRNLTAKNFCFMPHELYGQFIYQHPYENITGDVKFTKECSSEPTLSYNAETGLVTIAGCAPQGKMTDNRTATLTAQVSGYVYCFYVGDDTDDYDD